MGRWVSGKSPRFQIGIATRLYLVVGIMGLLIFAELATLRFAMGKLSAVRAFVGGESLWSKAQKNAVFSLQRYAATRDEFDFNQYGAFLSIPNGDHIARLELLKQQPNLDQVRRGFLLGKIHPDDIDPMVDLLLRFSWVEQLDRAIKAWTAADARLQDLILAGSSFRDAVRAHDEKRAAEVMDRVKVINEQLTELEEEFSNALGDGSRFLEYVVLTLLTLAVVMVESVGLGLAVITTRSISRGLKQLDSAAKDIGEGRFEPKNLPSGKDEIGSLADSISGMGLLLKKSYGELEARVNERTSELSRMAAENAQLYDDASRALERRDEFLSLASHELKTPITSLLLQAQMMKQNASSRSPEQIQKFSEFLERQLIRINELVEEMLDTARIDLSKLSLRLEPCDLSELSRDVSRQLEPQFQQGNTSLELKIEPAITGRVDSHRMEQVILNLLSNALKYAPGKPVEVKLAKVGSEAVLTVTDHGSGIPAGDRERIFGRFERGADPGKSSGLGIGLYIARAIVSAHGGALTVSDTPQNGARFEARIPLGPHS